MQTNPHNKHIISLIKPNSSVIDIGCADGEFAKTLAKQKSCKVQGVEIEAELVTKSIANNVATVLGEAPKDLVPFKDKSFDYAILANSLQVMQNPKEALEQALRIAKEVILIVPNFGNIKNRIYLGIKGKMPVTKELAYEWYETPNIHFSTLLDIKDLCKELRCEVKQKYILKSNKAKPFKSYFLHNIFSDRVLLVLGRYSNVR